MLTDYNKEFPKACNLLTENSIPPFLTALMTERDLTATPRNCNRNKQRETAPRLFNILQSSQRTNTKSIAVNNPGIVARR